MAFSTAQKAALRSGDVVSGLFVAVDFTSGVQRYYTGLVSSYTLPDATTWQGVGSIATITGLQAAINGTAPRVDISFPLHLAPEAVLQEYNTEAAGRTITVGLVLFDFDERPLSDSPTTIYTGELRSPRITVDAASGERRLTVTAESYFTKRASAAKATFTTTDQARRYAGDLGFEFIPSLQNQVTTWPDF